MSLTMYPQSIGFISRLITQHLNSPYKCSGGRGIILLTLKPICWDGSISFAGQDTALTVTFKFSWKSSTEVKQSLITKNFLDSNRT